jgi:hypothetical protein
VERCAKNKQKRNGDDKMSSKLTILFLIFSCVLFSIISPVGAYEVYVSSSYSTGQDSTSISGWVHELGNKPAFPNNEWIDSTSSVTSYRPCQQNPDTGIANIAVSITNLTNSYWSSLWYVADPETTFQNYDHYRINNQLAFRIDNFGLNTPLISESYNNNRIFEPGEIWTFVIQDYSNTLGLSASAFGSLGVPSASSLSSGSIITPEPCSLVLLSLCGLALLRKRRA